MKKQILTLLSILCFTFSFSQSNEDIAKVYINRAYNAIQESIDYKEALVQFNKAMEYTDTITSSKVAMLGTFIHYEVNNLEEAKSYAKQYFLLERKKSSDEYLELLGLYVTINEELEKQNAEEKRLEEERIKKEKELRKIDSLKIIWQSKSDTFSLKVDSIYTFNKKSLALFSKNGYFGIVNDLGNIIIEADTYKDALSFDGYFLLMDKSHEASQIYCYNINKKNGFLLPFPSDLNPLSTHFGKIMLPRGNGRLITYLNNSYAPLVYDLVAKKDVKVANEKELFKALKKNDIIDKFNKDGEIRINKKWYSFGGHIGGGIHPLYSEKNYKTHSFLCSIDGKMLTAKSDYQFIGAFYKNKAQAIFNNKTTWINQNGTKVNAPKSESGKYIGNSKIVKKDKGVYQIMKDGNIILGTRKLEKLAEFLRRHSDK